MFVPQHSFAHVGTTSNPVSNWQPSGHERWQSTEHRPTMALRPPTGHQRSLTEDNKRPPLVQMRSRSNTATSSSDIPFARKAMSPEFSLDSSSPRGSFDQLRSRPSRAERPESFRRTLVSKSSRLFKSRPTSRDDLTSLRPLDWSEEFENDICPAPVPVPAPEPAMPSRPASRHFRKLSKSDGQMSPVRGHWMRDRKTDMIPDALQRYNISEPFNFQHLTHTEPVQYKKMEEASPNDFVSEFSAMRASQAPRRELQGIKADNIIPRDDYYLSESDSDNPSPRRSSDGIRSNGSPDRLQHGLSSPPSPLQSLHHARSIDSISQISPILPRDPASSQIRATSRHFTPDFFADHQESPSQIENFPSIVQDAHYDVPKAPEYPIASWNAGVYDFTAPHAVTTPDDEVHTLRPPPFQLVRTELSRVLEEDEFSEGRRSIATVSTLRPTTPSTGLRASRSFPNLRQSPQKGTHAHTQSTTTEARSSIMRPSSIFEQIQSDIPDRPRSCEPVAPKEPETSWEDAIDWCYDNEAEADCNFDWHCDSPSDRDSLVTDNSDLIHIEQAPSMDSFKTTLLPCPVRTAYRSSSIYSMLPSPARLPQRASSIYSAMPPTPARLPQRASSIYSALPATPALAVPSQSYIPDLEPQSAISGHSSLDSVSEAVTPREASTTDLRQQVLTATCKPTCRDWTEHTPPPPVDDPESVMVYEDLYHVIYARKSLPEPVFDLGQIDGSTVSSVSPRSSRSAISKKSSQESVWSRHNRHSSSSASAPELIQGKSTDAPADQLTDRLQTLEATVTCADAGQAAAQRRRSRSLAREVAHNSVRSKVMSQDSFTSDMDEPLPYYTGSRDRSNSDASLRTYEQQSHARPQATRTRSGSSAASIKSTSSSKRYSLFPAAPVDRPLVR